MRELIHSCGDELGWCFTEDQVPVDAFFLDCAIDAVFGWCFTEDQVDYDNLFLPSLTFTLMMLGWCFTEDQVAFVDAFLALFDFRFDFPQR